MGLVPPLYEDNDKDTNNSDNNNAVRSKGLRDNFEAIKALDGVDDAERANKRRRLAEQTALLVESEFSRLQNGIDELEKLLQRQQEGAVDLVESDEDEEAVSFPSL